jgi:hypothetical protein
MARSRHHARILRGRAPGKTDSLYHRVGRGQPPRQMFFGFANISAFYSVAIALTSIVSSAKTPVTVAILPACLSSVAKTDLSLVCKI